jgi:hypothetical protein
VPSLAVDLAEFAPIASLRERAAEGTLMEPFVVLAIAAVLLVVFYVVWANRSKRSQSSGQRELPTDRDQGR